MKKRGIVKVAPQIVEEAPQYSSKLQQELQQPFADHEGVGSQHDIDPLSYLRPYSLTTTQLVLD